MEINKIVFIATSGYDRHSEFLFQSTGRQATEFFQNPVWRGSTLSGVRYEYSGGRKNDFFPGSTWSEDFSITGIGCRYDPRKSILKQGQAPYSTLQPVECHRIPLEFWAPRWLVHTEPIALQLSLRIKRQLPSSNSTQPPTVAWSYFYSRVAR